MTDKTGQKMFIKSLNEHHPERVLKNIRLDYMGFRALFDLPHERRLEVTINAFSKENGVLEVYEHLQGSEPGRYWLIDSGRYEVSGTDPLPLLEAYLKMTIGGIEHGYEGSFAEVVLAGYRRDVSEE